jgi:hypothetical protein
VLTWQEHVIFLDGALFRAVEFLSIKRFRKKEKVTNLDYYFIKLKTFVKIWKVNKYDATINIDTSNRFLL